MVQIAYTGLNHRDQVAMTKEVYGDRRTYGPGEETTANARLISAAPDLLEALIAAGIEIEPRWRIDTAPTRLEAAHLTGALSEGGLSPTAAVCYNDAVALGLQLGLLARGHRPGVDFAVVGFDDIPEASVSMPPLTTIATEPRARGRQAAERILARMQNPDAPIERRTAPVHLVVRESSGPPLSPTARPST